MMSRWLPIVSGGISILTTLALMARDYPLVGHDFRYFIPRLIDTDLHLRLNGLAIQWYTPTFGGGIPAFPNPQHLQYSLVQALTFISDPWIAVLATTAIAIGLGFWGCYRIANTNLGAGPHAATLAALFFVSCGFVIQHAIVGHVGFQLFPVAAVMLWTLIDRRLPDLSRGALLGLLVTLTLYHGGGLILILEAMAIAICLPMLVAILPQLLEWRSLGQTSAVAVLFAAFMSAPKVLSGMMLMRQFPRQVEADPVVPLTQAAAGFVSQLVGVQSIAPVLMALDEDPSRAYGVLVRLTGTRRLGVWELDTGLSPLVLVCLAIGAWWAWRAWRSARIDLAPIQRAAIAVTVVGLWIMTEAALGQGLIFPIVKTLPVMNSLHVHPRFGAAAILPLALLAGAGVDRWLRTRPAAGIAMIAVTLLAPASYFALPSEMHQRNFNVSPSLNDAKSLRGTDASIDTLAAVTDAQALSFNASSLKPYDPLFGYGNESFLPETREGRIRVLSDGYWNMTNPAGLVFPEQNGLRKFERIHQADRARLDQLLRRRQPDWNLPRSVVWATRIALPALMLCLFAIAIGVRSSRAAR